MVPFEDRSMQRSILIFVLFLISHTSSSRLNYRASVKENVDLYHTIISLDKMLAVNYQQSIEFLNLNSPYTTYFLVDGQKLRTSRLIDREEFCRIKLCEHSSCQPCEIHMDFVLKENSQVRDIISLVLTIEDVNEFRPEFLDEIINLNISEGVPVGHVLPIPSATDKDGEEDELHYQLEKNKKIPFDLISFGSNQIALNVTEPLDRETEDFYELKLTASDRENLTSTVSIHISISDINDNVPIFDQQTPYVFNISESTIPSLNRPLFRIHAMDHDSDENSRVTYHFSHQQAESIRRTFQLDSQTGEFFLVDKLDYEQNKEYRIPITAQDSGPVSVPVYTMIIINVEDENDNKPWMTLRISEYFQFVNHTLIVSEETPLNTLLMHVLVEDFDSNLNGQVRCWTESSDFVKFNITNTINNMFSLYTAQLFDRENRSSYHFRLIIEDSGLKVRHQTFRDLQILITDINDCSPTFSQSSYNLTIEEEKEYSQSIITFHADDADDNDNSRISYELFPNEYPQLFHLNNQTGELFLLKKLDREYKSDYNLTIRAQDHGKYPSTLSTTTYCYMKILDKNEFKPQFERKKYFFDEINETLPINTSIGFIQAIDHDEDIIQYSISSSNFQVDSSTGELFIKNQLDYDTDDSCEHFMGIARDRDGLNSTCQIEICLQPINEYFPELQLESPFIYINLDNTSSIQLSANDQDISPSSFLSFHCEKTSLCNLTCLSNGTIYINEKENCFGTIDLFIRVNDNDLNPSAKITNTTIHLVFYSNTITLEQVLSGRNYKFTIEMIIISMILILISIITCLVLFIAYRQHKQRIFKKPQESQTTIKDSIGSTKTDPLLKDNLLDITHLNFKPPSTSETGSSYNDSCYGSSEMDVYHHNQLNGKLVLSSNDKFIILCKDQNNISNTDDTNSSSSSSCSSSSPTGNNHLHLITKYQAHQPSSAQYQTQFFQNEHEHKKIQGSSTKFNYRNLTPLNEYYL